MQFIQTILDIIFPPRCVGCQKSGHVLCPSCISQIPLLTSPLCQRCSRPLTVSGICKQCQYYSPNLSGLRAVSVYQEPLRAYIHALKYEGNTRLAKPLGQLLAQAYLTYGMRTDAVLPEPLHSERQQKRGYNHAYLLAAACANHIGIPLYNNILVRHRATSAQVGLNSGDRRQNVAGAFLCTPAFATHVLYGRTLLIIDDVYTTGATLEACAAPLFAAGARAVWGLVLARPL
jgi:ComF family protein